MQHDPMSAAHASIRRTSAEKRRAALAAIAALESRGVEVTISAVAREAHVSRWLVYDQEILEVVRSVQNRQSNAPSPQDRTTSNRKSSASLVTELELARRRLRSCEEERKRLSAALDSQLGAEASRPGLAEMGSEIDQLNFALAAERKKVRSLAADITSLRSTISAKEDELVEVRLKLTDAIRRNNR